MFGSLLSKDLLYPSLKELRDAYPEWLALERNASLPASERQRFESQHRCITAICELFEAADEPDHHALLEKLGSVRGCWNACYALKSFAPILLSLLLSFTAPDERPWGTAEGHYGQTGCGGGCQWHPAATGTGGRSVCAHVVPQMKHFCSQWI